MQLCNGYYLRGSHSNNTLTGMSKFVVGDFMHVTS